MTAAALKLSRLGDGHYRVLFDGVPVGRVWRETSSKARHVKGVGGVTRWVATSTRHNGEVVTRINTYTRAHAIEQLMEAFA